MQTRVRLSFGPQRRERNNVADIAWCRSASCVYDWLADFQLFAAALCAIAAALILYFGIRSRARAALRDAREARAAGARAAAAALWSELAYTFAKLTTDARALRSEDFLKGGNVTLRLSKTPIFDAQPGRVGELPDALAFAAAHAYQLVKNLDDTYREVLTAKAVTRPQVDQLARLVEDVAAVVRSTLNRLQETGAISRETADSAISLYTAFGAPRPQDTDGTAAHAQRPQRVV